MIITYTFLDQYYPIEGNFFIENNSFSIKEFRSYLSKKYNLNIAQYNIFHKKKKLNDDYIIFGNAIMIIHKKCELSPNDRRKLILKTRKMLS